MRWLALAVAWSTAACGTILGIDKPGVFDAATHSGGDASATDAAFACSDDRAKTCSTSSHYKDVVFKCVELRHEG